MGGGLQGRRGLDVLRLGWGLQRGSAQGLDMVIQGSLGAVREGCKERECFTEPMLPLGEV